MYSHVTSGGHASTATGRRNANEPTSGGRNASRLARTTKGRKRSEPTSAARRTCRCLPPPGDHRPLLTRGGLHAEARPLLLHIPLDLTEESLRVEDDSVLDRPG